MTPFGHRLRQLRSERGISLKAMAAALGVSAAYLSALEHGYRGKPTWSLVQHIIAFFNIIWDEADELKFLAQISAPRVTVDTSGLTPQATFCANRLAREFAGLQDHDIAAILTILDARREARRDGA
jgi:transcriptional regulator with XRE-family HTH domain